MPLRELSVQFQEVWKVPLLYLLQHTGDKDAETFLRKRPHLAALRFDGKLLGLQLPPERSPAV